MISGGLSTEEVKRLRLEYGWNEIAERTVNPLLIFLKKFSGPSAWMIEAIAALSFFLHKPADSAIALALLFINATISFLEEHHAESTVQLLRQRLQVTARALRDNQWMQIPARELVPGDKVNVRLGNISPGDLTVESGDLEIDQSILTGESGNLKKSNGDTIFSGSLVRRGEATCVVKSIGANTYYGRTIELVQSARPRLHIEELVSKLVRTLFGLLLVLLSITILAALSRGSALADILPLSLILLMSAVPVALPVMFTVSTAIAAKRLGEKGVLITRLSAAEDAATLDTLFVDKTGTITENRLTVVGVLPEPGVNVDELLRFAAVASSEASRDAIDDAVLKYCSSQNILDRLPARLKFVPFSPETRRTEAVIRESQNEVIVTKGAVTEILDWSGAEQNEARRTRLKSEQAAKDGYRSIAVARTLSDGNRKFLGLISLQDPPRPESLGLIKQLREIGIRVKMLTGDAQAIAQEIAKKVCLGPIATWTGNLDEIDWNRMDGLAQVFPETKFHIIELTQSQGHVVGMTGDGVNDAPALRRAEVGIAVHTATDAAKSAASVVLTTEGLSGIVDLIENGRAVYQRILTWIINKISRTTLKAGFVVAAYFIYGEFIISAFAMILLVFATDFAKISLSTDNVRISLKPDSWAIRPLISLGVLLGGLMVIESLLLLWIGTHLWGISIPSRKVHTLSFLILLFMAVFSVVSIRERKSFLASRPNRWLVAALSFDAALGVLIGSWGIPNLPPIGLVPTAIMFLLSAAITLSLNDFVKVRYLRMLNESVAP